MSRLFYQTMQDNAGNLLFDVSGTMRLAGSGTLATIYGDEALTVILPNPMTNHPSFGSFKCFLGAGDYDFYMAKAGYTFETLTGVQGHGTMAQQDANAVAITGGTALGLTTLTTGDFTADGNTLVVNAATDRVGLLNFSPEHTLDVNGDVRLRAMTGFGSAPLFNTRTIVWYPKSSLHGLTVRPTDNDTGGFNPVLFSNQAGTTIGSIGSSGAAVSFNTSSDVRLKHAITPLTGALDKVAALRPVAFRWNSTDELAHGFLAHELQQVIADAVTGEPDAVNEDGSVKPQQVDHSKLVPWLTAALQDMMAQVQALTARVTNLETQLGV